MGKEGPSTQPGTWSLASLAATTRENVPEMSQQGGAQSRGGGGQVRWHRLISWKQPYPKPPNPSNTGAKQFPLLFRLI